MNHADHVALLREGIDHPGGMWADFGSGTGAFTLALADLIGPAGVIYSIEQDRSALAQQERSLQARFPNSIVHYRLADFTRPLELPALDGNSAVPYPVSYRQWEDLAKQCGFTQTRLLRTRPSRFLKEIYSAVSV